MNRFCGKIGFAVTVDEGDGVWKEKITDKKYTGDILRLVRNKDSGEHITDGLRLNSQFSILMDPWFEDHFSSVRYIEYLGTKWVIETADPTNYPRVLLTPGGIYHGDEPEPNDGNGSESQTEEGTPEEVGGDSGE